jgi:hypothetical protein
VTAAVLLLAGPIWGYRTWVRRISQSWPVAEAKLESGDVSASGRRYVLRVRYSYSVTKGLYGGEYYKYFRTQAEADYLWKSLGSLMPLVRYDPRNPTRSYFDPYRDVRVEELGSGEGYGT